MVLKQFSKTTKTGFQLSIHVMANRGEPQNIKIVETTSGTNGVNLLENPPDYTGNIHYGKSWAPKMIEKHGKTDHIRELLNPYEENPNYGTKRRQKNACPS